MSYDRDDEIGGCLLTIILSGGCILALFGMFWFLLDPPWHYIEKTQVRGVACSVSEKIGEQVQRSGRHTYTAPIGSGLPRYRVYSALQEGATIRNEKDMYYSMMGHCEATANSAKFFPSVGETTRIYGDPREWEEAGYKLVEWKEEAGE